MKPLPPRMKTPPLVQPAEFSEAPASPSSPPRTLAEARAVVEAQLFNGTTCPCCYSKVKAYRRCIHPEMVRFLKMIVQRSSGGEWIRARDILQGNPKASTDAAYLTRWGLVESGGKGLYRPTLDGIAFAEGRLRVPSACWIRNDEGHTVVRWSDTEVSIYDVLGRQA